MFNPPKVVKATRHPPFSHLLRIMFPGRSFFPDAAEEGRYLLRSNLTSAAAPPTLATLRPE